MVNRYVFIPSQSSHFVHQVSYAVHLCHPQGMNNSPMADVFSRQIFFKNKLKRTEQEKEEVGLSVGGFKRRLHDEMTKEYLDPIISGLSGLERPLSRLASDTEDEFLALGRRLQDFAERAQQMTGQASRIAALIGDGQGEGTVEQARQVIESTLNDLDASNLEIKKGLALLSDVSDRLKGLTGAYSGLRNISKRIRMLGINIKIESARVGEDGKGFHSLAREVTGLSSMVQENSWSFENNSRSTYELILSCVSEMSRRAKGYDEQIIGVRDRIHALLESLRGIMQDSARVSKTISQRSADISRRVGDVVVAMQFHDITRQQLEHVTAALKDIRNGLTDKTTSPDPSKDSMAGWLYQALSIQAAQLNEIRRHIETAGSDIVNGLEEVVRLTVEQADDVISLASAGVSATDGSIVSRIEKEVQGIVSAFSEGVQVSSRMIEVLDSVSDSATKMETFVAKIEEIGSKIKLLALNALAEATRTGNNGRALRILAQELHHLSMDSEGSTGSAVAVLKAVSDTARLDREFSATLERQQGETESMAQDALRLAEAIGRVSDEIKQLARDLEEQGQALTSEISALIPSIRFPTVMIQGIVRGVDRLKGFLSEIERSSPDLHMDDSSLESLNEMASRYSMEKEREVHRQVANGSPSETTDSIPSTPSDDGNDVELFDNVPGTIDDQEQGLAMEDVEEGRQEKAVEEFGDNVELF